METFTGAASGTITVVAVRTEPAPSRLINRELSWLDSSERLLDLASDTGQPLLERVKFCAIFSSILDEFFMVRVAGLVEQEGRASACGQPTASRRTVRWRRSGSA
jgi:polyphosphate kinase